jgi:hypothetical protein
MSYYFHLPMIARFFETCAQENPLGLRLNRDFPFRQQLFIALEALRGLMAPCCWWRDQQ